MGSVDWKEAANILQKTYGILQYVFYEELPAMSDVEKAFHLEDLKDVIDLINQEK